ncbi:receptor-type tyrosine-protein phosphatase delta-like [Asterias rubens]|uniref:receptor-type tyrosine-protein phosphatase delta-like n=1 Tax=Asterias rubens TaxID=7604 RepID=UPI00145573CB|nr:receptor-type tyrosine-protein phosphatase delta-like [Asterias rubens]
MAGRLLVISKFLVVCLGLIGVRLVGGSASFEGRVEVFHDGQWGTVCDDFWNITDANVVCRQLGYVEAASAWQNAHFGAGTGQTLMDDVNCSENEDKLQDCAFKGWGIEDCSHSEDASVTCETAPRAGITAPGAATGLTAVAVGSDTLSVSWGAPSGDPCPAIDYTVTYELTNLEQCPTGVPVISVSSSSTRSIRFTWSQVPCGQRRGPITRYRYVLQRTSLSSPTAEDYTSSTSKTFTGLSPCTSYTLKIRAFTSSGSSGPWTAQKHQNTTAIAPEGVTSLHTTLPTSTEIHVSWQRPTNCFVDQLTVEYQLDNRDQCGAVHDQTRKSVPSVSQSPVTITGLYPHSTYSVYVTPSNKVGRGAERSTVATTTGIAPSGPPTRTRASDVTNTTITFSWDLPECGKRYGVITEYQFTLANAANGEQTTGVIKPTTKRVADLWPYTFYTFTVHAVNHYGSGPSSSVTQMTKYGVPSKPGSFVVANFSQTTVALVWSEPQMPNGLIKKYSIEYRVLARPYDTNFKFNIFSAFKVHRVVDLSSLEAVIVDLEPSTKYELQIWAVNHAGIEGHKDRLDVYTEMATDLPTPDTPILIGNESTVSSIAIRLVNKRTSTYISSYQIGVRDISSGLTPIDKISKRYAPEFRHHDEDPSAYIAAELPATLPGKFVVGDNKTYGGYWNPPLQEGAVYEIYVGAVSRINEKMASIVWNDKPLTIDVDGDYSEINVAFAVVITLLVSVVIAALLAAVLLIRRQRSKRPQRRTSTVSNDAVELESTHKCSPINQCSAPTTAQPCARYTQQSAACVSKSNAVGVSIAQSSAGNLRTSSTDCSYEVYTVPAEEIFPEPSKGMEPRKWPAVSTKGAVKLTPYLRGNSREAASSGSVASPESDVWLKSAASLGSDKSFAPASPKSAVSPSSVSVVNLAQFIEGRKMDSNAGFKQDFKVLSTQLTHSRSIAKMKENAKKNRYINILPYDYSRVVLDALDGDSHSDYINASYIDGYKRKSRYIACQGPNQVTVNDMWRMIWQERIGKIIMLTNLVEKEKDKCEKYWPDQSSMYGEFIVTNVKEESHPTFILRTFKVSKIVVEGESFQVLQYHYIAWPDIKPPESSSLLQFVGRVHQSEKTYQGSIMVHCSTGAGRTGTFIALDILLEQSEAEGQVDVLKCVSNVNDRRYQLVQTMDQYQFIFETLSVSSQQGSKVLSRDQQTPLKPKKSEVRTGVKIYDNLKLRHPAPSSNMGTRYTDSHPVYVNWKK